MSEILFVNACARKASRTLRLARYLLSLIAKPQDQIVEINLYDLDLKPFDEKMLAKRDELINKEAFEDGMFALARNYKNADIIIIAAPYWDISYPAILKIFFEHIQVEKLTFLFSEKGEPTGLCKAEKLFYVTTAGGPLPENHLGLLYVKELAQTYHGIDEVIGFAAENLDVIGVDVEKELDQVKAQMKDYIG